MERDENVSGRRDSDKWAIIKNLALVFGFLLNALAFAYWVGTGAKQLDINIDNIKVNADNIKANALGIAQIEKDIKDKHFDKDEIKEFVILPVKEELNEIKDSIYRMNASITDLHKTNNVLIREYKYHRTEKD